MSRAQLTPQERKHFNKAYQSYKRALRAIGERKHCPGIWDAVTWELSTVLYTVSDILHKNPPTDVSESDAEKQVLEAIQTALDHCDLDETNPKYPLYQFRAAMLHVKCGCLWHSHICNPAAADTKRYSVQLAQHHYEKASKLFFEAGDAIHFLSCEMHRMALTEHLIEYSTSAATKLKHLQSAIKYFLEINKMLEMLVTQKVQVPVEQKTSTSDDTSFESLQSLLILIKKRLQHSLKMLIKICLSKPSPTKDSPKLAETYKACYKVTFSLSDEADCDDLLQSLFDALVKIAEIQSQ